MDEEISGRIADIVADVIDQTGRKPRGSVDEYVAALRILAAIREPTDAMIKAATETPEANPRLIWFAMIDRALGEALDDAHRIGREAANEEMSSDGAGA